MQSTLMSSGNCNATQWVARGVAAFGLLFAVEATAAVTVNKTFSPSSMTVGGTSTVTITLGNTGTSAATAAAFTDTLPSGLTVAAPSNVATTCGGTATAGGGTIALSGGTIAASGGTCTVTASVTSSTLGSYTNTIPAGGVTSSQGSNGSAASATLAVIARQPVTGSWVVAFPPGFSGNLKGNGPAYTYTLTLNNSNTLALTNTGLTFSLPMPTLAFASPSNLTTTCGGTVTANTVAGTGTLSGGTIPGSGSCTIKLDVIAAQPNVYFIANTVLTLPASAITDDQGVTNSAAINTAIGVQTGARVDKSFSPNPIPSGGISTLTLTINNFNYSALSPIGLTDTLPSGMSVAPTPNVSTTCTGGTVTAIAGSGSIQLAGGSLPSVAATATNSVTCTVKVDVVGTNAGTANINLANAIPAGNFAGVGYPAVSTNLTVTPGGDVQKSFSPATIAVGGISTLTIQLFNSTSTSISPVNLTDTMPSGLAIAATPNITNTCGGTVTASAGSGSVQLSSGTLAAAPSQGSSSSCTITVDVTASTLGAKVNTIAGGTWNGISYSSGTATLTVGAPFTATKVVGFRTYGTHRIAFAGYVHDATITLTNNTTSPIAITSLTDDLTTMGSGYTVASTSAPATTCGGTVSAPANGTTITMSGGTIPASGSCTITVPVHFQLAGTALGTRTNTIAAGNIVTNAGSNATATNSPSVEVYSPLEISKSFAPAAVNAGGRSTLTIALRYRSDPALGVAVDSMTNISDTDTLPAGVVIATPSTSSTTCTGATITAPAGGSTIGFSGVSMNSGDVCTLSVDVLVPAGTAPGTLNNVIPASSVSRRIRA